MPDKHICIPCTFSTNLTSNWNTHILRQSHLRKCAGVCSKKETIDYVCVTCNFKTTSKSNYTRHLETPVHAKRSALNPTASIVTQEIEIEEDLLVSSPSKGGGSDIRLILNNSTANDINDFLNERFQSNQVSMFKFMETKRHGRIIIISEMDKLMGLIGDDSCGLHLRLFAELFQDMGDSSIICNSLKEKECRFKIGNEWKRQTLSSYLKKDHVCESCKTINHDFQPTCKTCMECVRTRKPEYAHLGGYEIDAMIETGCESPYTRTYQVTDRTFKENIIHFHICCLRGLISNISNLTFIAMSNTFMLHKCKELSLSRNVTDDMTKIFQRVVYMPSHIEDRDERQKFKFIYSALCEMTVKTSEDNL